MDITYMSIIAYITNYCQDRLRLTVFFKAIETVFGNNNMIDNFNSQHPSSFDKALCQNKIGSRWFSISRWVIVGDYYLRCRAFNRRLKHLSGMDRINIKRTNRYDFSFYFLVAAVEIKNKKMFFLLIAVIPQLFPYFFRR